MEAYETPAERHQAEESAAYLRELQSKARWREDSLKAKAERVEAEKVEAIRVRIQTSIASLYFLREELSRIQPEYAVLLKEDSGGYWLDPNKKHRVDFVTNEIAKLEGYLNEQRNAGQPFTSAAIDEEVDRFAHIQGAPSRLAKAVASAEVKNLRDAQPQPSVGKPMVTYPCPKCGSSLREPNLAMHLNGDDTWCVIDAKRARAAGRDAYRLLSEGNVTVEELQAAGIVVPKL